MSAARLLQEARRTGVEVYADGGTIKMRGPSVAVQQVATQLRPHRAELLALLARQPANDAPTVAAPPTCHSCAHRTAAGTCGDPVAAGLAQTFGIRWPDSGYAARCLAYTPPPTDPEAWRAHLAQPADDAELALMARRVVRFEALGMPSELADRTADRLLARDREGDTRQLCAVCAACRFDAFTETWRCSSRMGMAGALQRIFVTEQLQRCPGFSLSHHLRPEEGDRHA